MSTVKAMKNIYKSGGICILAKAVWQAIKTAFHKVGRRAHYLLAMWQWCNIKTAFHKVGRAQYLLAMWQWCV